MKLVARAQGRQIKPHSYKRNFRLQPRLHGWSFLAANAFLGSKPIFGGVLTLLLDLFL